jgi:nitrate/TMAO reductase-like tetraheme cytochrome c subunit
MTGHFSMSGALALGCALLAAGILVWYLVFRPRFSLATQLWLFLGLGALPILTAFSGNVAGYEATKSVEFCSSCHVMLAHTGDARDPHSQSLAARHSRNAMFGDKSCYECHADYGLFGAVFTKLNGMHHVYEYLIGYRKKTLDEALPELELYKPFPNHNCMQCHSTTTKTWLDVSDHASALSELRNGQTSCASEGCHGYAHPFSKAARERAHNKGATHARPEGAP